MIIDHGVKHGCGAVARSSPWRDSGEMCGRDRQKGRKKLKKGRLMERLRLQPSGNSYLAMVYRFHERVADLSRW